MSAPRLRGGGDVVVLRRLGGGAEDEARALGEAGGGAKRGEGGVAVVVADRAGDAVALDVAHAFLLAHHPGQGRLGVGT